ncbi:MAG: BrnT family toxin [Burkholderiaceae bacterium]|nr:BrnT family toxin [Burkholderiaceae bacterium]
MVATLIGKIEFDLQEDRANVTKHDVSLKVARELEWDGALDWLDQRVDYGEERLTLIALAPQANRLFYVAFVIRGGTHRIISLRRANRREVKHYVKQIKAQMP